jgi:plastocyanin
VQSIARLAAFAIAAFAVACGGTATPSATVPPPISATTTITYSGFAVSPASVEVKIGEVVAWWNKDSSTHTVTAGKPGAKTGTFDKQLPANGADSMMFSSAGTFDFFCELHPSIISRVTVR